MQLDARRAPEGDAAALRADGDAEGREVRRAQVAVEAAGAGFDGDGGVGGAGRGGGVGGGGADGRGEGPAARVEAVFAGGTGRPAARAGVAVHGGHVVVGAWGDVAGGGRVGGGRAVLFWVGGAGVGAFVRVGGPSALVHLQIAH